MPIDETATANDERRSHLTRRCRCVRVALVVSLIRPETVYCQTCGGLSAVVGTGLPEPVPDVTRIYHVRVDLECGHTTKIVRPRP